MTWSSSCINVFFPETLSFLVRWIIMWSSFIQYVNTCTIKNQKVWNFSYKLLRYCLRLVKETKVEISRFFLCLSFILNRRWHFPLMSLFLFVINSFESIIVSHENISLNDCILFNDVKFLDWFQSKNQFISDDRCLQTRTK